METDFYWLLFAAALLALVLWEVLRPWRNASRRLARRWANHALLFGISSAAATVISRATPLTIALLVSNSRFGLLNRNWLPVSVRCILGFLLIDLLRYALHRGFHCVPALWRVHQVHHSDPHLDLSTGIRNHPLEALVAQIPIGLTIALVAPPPMAVLAAEMLALLSAFFTHANANLPSWLERCLKLVMVTPRIHRIHHSEEIGEQNANFGEILPCWDRMFGTYLDAPAADFDQMRLGLKEAAGQATGGLVFLLAEPFRSRRATHDLQDRQRALLAKARVAE